MDSPTPLRPAKTAPDNVALAKGCLIVLLVGAFILAFWAAFLFITISAFD